MRLCRHWFRKWQLKQNTVDREEDQGLSLPQLGKMKTTKGGKVMNPTDAYRKELRKKELKRVFLRAKRISTLHIVFEAVLWRSCFCGPCSLFFCASLDLVHIAYGFRRIRRKGRRFERWGFWRRTLKQSKSKLGSLRWWVCSMGHSSLCFHCTVGVKLFVGNALPF